MDKILSVNKLAVIALVIVLIFTQCHKTISNIIDYSLN